SRPRVLQLRGTHLRQTYVFAADSRQVSRDGWMSAVPHPVRPPLTNWSYVAFAADPHPREPLWTLHVGTRRPAFLGRRSGKSLRSWTRCPTVAATSSGKLVQLCAKRRRPHGPEV